jgi:hypothetical protein
VITFLGDAARSDTASARRKMIDPGVVSVDRELFERHKNFDAPRDPRLPADKPCSLEGENHLVDGGRADTEMPLKIGFDGRPAEHARISIDEGQILTLLGREARNSGWGRHR